MTKKENGLPRFFLHYSLISD